MASMSLSIENCLIQVRARLQEEGVKLWLAPYYVDGIGAVDAELENLALVLNQQLNLPFDYCLAALNELQTNAVDKLKSRELFRETGTATIKVRVPGKGNGARLLTLQTRLDILAEDLHDQIGMKLEVTPAKLKLISSGRIINRLQTLQDQGVQNNQQVMAIVLDDEEGEASKSGSTYDKLSEARNDANLLLKKDDSYMDMEDQDGNIIHLPPEEKRALMMALAMHEKGRASLKRDDFNEALIFLVEADSQYNTCNSKMVESVDNYALLNLDIVWCYLMLKSVSHLPDADKRLKICERSFKKSYGENLDRVMSLKGNAVNERSLIMRLHLLQAIMCFHQNQRNEAYRLIQTAELEWDQLQVNDQMVQSLTEMGYSTTESRIGLRACANNIDQAITYILDRREQRKNARKKGQAERRVNKSLAKTNNSKWVNPRNLHILNEMGFDKDICALALQKTDNDINQAISLLQTNESILQDELTQSIVPKGKLCDAMKAMGFHDEMIQMALKNCTNDMEKAIESLLKMQSDGTYDSAMDELLKNMPLINNSGPSTSASTSTHHIEEAAKEMEAFERFSEDIENNEDDYLDLPLLQERTLLNEYKKLLNL